MDRTATGEGCSAQSRDIQMDVVAHASIPALGKLKQETQERQPGLVSSRLSWPTQREPKHLLKELPREVTKSVKHLPWQSLGSSEPT